jgi:Tfp pilus assembly protein PilV
MHQTIQQKRAILDVLRQRAQQATADFNAKPRFVVIPHQNNLFGVLDTKTGVERAEVAGHNSACHAAQSFENVASFNQAAQVTVGNYARLMLRWTLCFAVLLAVFAFIGVQR